MIKMISGIYGMPVKHPDGRITVKGIGPKDGAFSLAPEKEKRLVDRKVAVYVFQSPAEIPTVPAAPVPVADETVDDGAPIGFDEVPEVPAVPEYSADMKAAELREIGAEYGLTLKVGMTKAEMIAALDDHFATMAEDEEVTDDEPAPAFDASEAVQ